MIRTRISALACPRRCVVNATRVDKEALSLRILPDVFEASGAVIAPYFVRCVLTVPLPKCLFATIDDHRALRVRAGIAKVLPECGRNELAGTYVDHNKAVGTVLGSEVSAAFKGTLNQATIRGSEFFVEVESCDFEGKPKI